MSDLYVGLMSGTSADGIDAALVDFSDAKPKLIAANYTPYSHELRQQILSLCQPGENEIKRLGELDIILGKSFAQATLQLLEQQSISPSSITAIGSHGQTIRHHPHHPHRFTMQIGDPNVIAAETHITTVADFRRRDMALGGQGAPLVPAFHQQIFADGENDRAIVNIGGIANVTILPKRNGLLRPQKKRPRNDENGDIDIIGFDTGPGNVLLDAWIFKHQQKQHDEAGSWAQTGKTQIDLLEKMLADPFFQLSAPKSTGREYFNLNWFNTHISDKTQIFAAADIQATLAELTAQTICAAIKSYFSTGELLVCGGGAHNEFLMQRLQANAGSTFNVASTLEAGVDPDWVEAIAFAWLAKQTLHKKPSNLPSVTGASKAAILGGVYFAE